MLVCCGIDLKKSKTPKWPTKRDYKQGGQLYGVSIPYYFPIPQEFVQFIYGTNKIEQSKIEWLKVITRLNSDNGFDVFFCDCCDWVKTKLQVNKHYLKKQTFEIPMKSIEFHNMML